MQEIWLDITCIPAKNNHIFVLSFSDPIFYPSQWLNISDIAIKIHLLAEMCKATKRRRCQPCGTSTKSHSLESLLKHMESSAICKEVIKTCESRLMKFPDESSLVKHNKSLKKQSLDTNNLGLMDPSIAFDQPSIHFHRRCWNVIYHTESVLLGRWYGGWARDKH
jgi:hypothetical protein